MRIIAGTWRGRKLLSPIGMDTRPILDRIKASLFDMLGSHYHNPGRIPGFPVLDLFCGTGSLGLEALSRGATCCTFVERDRSALRRLRRNIGQFKATDLATVLPGNALTVSLLEDTRAPYRLVFVDPPYARSRERGSTGLIARLFDRFNREGILHPEALLVCRHESKVSLEEALPPYHRIDLRRYGGMALSFYKRGRKPVETVDEAHTSS